MLIYGLSVSKPRSPPFDKLRAQDDKLRAQSDNLRAQFGKLRTQSGRP
jgi:hypothetical protein